MLSDIGILPPFCEMVPSKTEQRLDELYVEGQEEYIALGRQLDELLMLRQAQQDSITTAELMLAQLLRK